MKVKLILLIIGQMNSAFAQTINSFIPERIQKSASFTVNTTIEKAFPLFGPVREKAWAAGWEPQIIYSTHPEAEEHMVFKTSGNFHTDGDYLWVISQFRPADYFIEYTVSTTQRLWFVSVQCASMGKNTSVRVTYTYTGLSEHGNQLNRLALEKMYAHDLADWEEAINYYIATGKQKEN
jgi:hypothetical protein